MEFYFNLKKAGIYQALKWGWVLRWAKICQKIYFILFISFFLLFLYGFLGENFSENSNSAFLGLTIISLALFISRTLRIVFFNQKMKRPKIINENNLAEFLSFEAAKAVYKSKSANATSLLYFLIADNHKLNFVFSRLLLDLKEIKKTLKSKMRENRSRALEDFQNIIFESWKIAQKRGHQRIGAGDMLAVLVKHNSFFQQTLVDNKLKARDVENLARWLESLEKRIKEGKKWWEYQNLTRRGTLAKAWTAGYTPTLDKHSIDWTEIARKRGFPEIIGHKKELGRVERILARREYNNVLLAGQPGSGRKGVIQGLVLKSVLGQSLAEVNYKRVVELDIPGLLAENPDSRAVEVVLDKIFQEAISAGNIILVINEFHNFIEVKPGPGKVDISGVISSYLHFPQFQIVAVTSFTGLHKNIEQNPSILNLFEKVVVSEISENDLMMILENLALQLEQRYKLFISYPALRDIVSLSRRFMPAMPFPKKALDLLDEVMIYVKKSTKDKVVLPFHVAKIISEKAQMPIGEIEAREKDVLLNLENLIHQRIINQEEAVKEVSASLRRARAEVHIGSGPIGTFLFLGPTGVGKTETSKALTEIYFGKVTRMIRLDMSEFQQVSDIPRLIGSPQEEGLLTTKIREAPFSLILLDEIEKAHPNILNLFLQVLDEGFLTDGLGRKVDFKNSIIISTSNAGYQIILKSLREKTDWNQVEQKLFDYLFEKAIFRPEFINRFDAVVVFKPLSKENLLSIAGLLFQKLRESLKEKGIEFIITSSLKEKIVELSYNPIFGAREMKRVIQNKIENVLASALLSGELKRGMKIEINSDSFKLIIK